MNKALDKIIRIGSRGSELAMIQAGKVKAALESAHPAGKFRIVEVKTSGDSDLNTPLTKMGGAGVFVKELERKLTEGEIDIAVHSAKDLPSGLNPRFALGAVTERESVEDALVCREDNTLASLPAGAVIATGSPRRRALLKWYRRDLKTADIRGNVDTRLRKLQSGEYDAILLAYAGLKRLGKESVVSQLLPPDKFPPAPGQGAIAVEVRADDREIRELAGMVDCPEMRIAVEAERSLLYRLNAGCSSAVGAWARCSAGVLRIDAVVLDLEGENLLAAASEMPVDNPASEITRANAVALGSHTAEKLLKKGAEQLMSDWPSL